MKFKLANRKAAVLAYCAAFNLGAKHPRAMKHGVEVLRLTCDKFDKHEAGVQLIRDLMQTGLLRVDVKVEDRR